jgi:hypothetical protein
MNQKENSSIKSAEMVYLRSVKGCTRPDCFPSENTGQGLKVTPVTSNIYIYRKRRGEHLLKMDGSRIPKIAFEYYPKGRRHVGRPRKRWAL